MLTREKKEKIPEVPYDPSVNPQQMKAHKAWQRYILYGGAYGGGKTAWLIGDGIALSLEYPGNRGFLGCRFLTDFRDNALTQLEKFLPPQIIRIHHKTERYFQLTNGSVIMYGGVGNDAEAIKAISNMPELGWFGIDQAEQITERQFLLFDGRLRLVLPGIRYHALLTANPEPGWLRDRFIENCYPDHLFIPALPSDNPFLPPDYEERLKKIYPEAMAKRLLEGNWDVEVEGNYLIPYEDIRKAINRDLTRIKPSPMEVAYAVLHPTEGLPVGTLELEGDRVAGVDISRYGQDETVYTLRQGNKVLHIEAWAHEDTTYSAGRVARLIREHKPTVTNIDSVAVGAGVFDPLKNDNLPVEGINVGEKALDHESYANKRAELFGLLAKKFKEGEIDIPDNQKLASQLASIKYRYNSKMQMLIESKETVRSHGGKSPDYADSLMLAFAGSYGGSASDSKFFKMQRWG